MQGHILKDWQEYKYEGSLEDEYLNEEFGYILRSEKRYDYAWDREWNNLGNIHMELT